MLSTKADHPTVFLSAGYGADLALVRALLDQAQLGSITWDELPASDLVASLNTALDACDVVVAVVDTPVPPPAVLVEVGAAIGRGRTVVVLVTAASYVQTLPPVLRTLPVIVLGGDLAAVAARIVETISAIVLRREDRRPMEPVHVSSTAYRRQVESRSWSDAAEERVALALVSLGARVQGQVPANTRGRVDLAAWLPHLPSPELNPILVEVAGRRPQLTDKEQQLRHYLTAQHAFVGIRVTAEDDPPQWRLADGTAIVTLGVETLERLTQDDFVRLLTVGRNRLVHGT